MFHKPENLLKRTPVDGTNRPEFLKQLVQEFRKTNSAGKNIQRPVVCTLNLRRLDTRVLHTDFLFSDSKRQVLANLANFAYDPINYPHIRAHGVIDLFIEQLGSDDDKLSAFAAAGLCNLSNGIIT